MTRWPWIVAATLLAATGTLAAQDEVALVASHDEEGLSWGACPGFMPEGCAIAVLHGEASQPNADIFYKVPGGAHVPAHRHTSAERMLLVAGEMEVHYEGQPAATLRRGDYAYGPPGRVHSATCAPGSDCVLFIAFEPPIDAMPAAAAQRP